MNAVGLCSHSGEVTGRFGPIPVRTRVVSVLFPFGPGSFRPGSLRHDFRGGSFRSNFGGSIRPTLIYIVFFYVLKVFLASLD